MSVREQKKQESRDRIVAAASRLMRERGIGGIGVADLMREAGLTHGAFYSHFDSREQLVAEAVEHAADRSRSRLFAKLGKRRGIDWLRGAVQRYLSREHRDHPEQGCPLTSFSGEIARRNTDVRTAFDRVLEEAADGFRYQLDEAGAADPRGRSLALLALCTGGLALSRAAADPRLSDSILKACRELAMTGIER
jgi:TetR/AcrR family transcriptional repressor of nem operon